MTPRLVSAAELLTVLSWNAPLDGRSTFRAAPDRRSKLLPAMSMFCRSGAVPLGDVSATPKMLSWIVFCSIT